LSRRDVWHTEVNEDVVKALGHLLQKSARNLGVRRVFREIDWDENLLRLGVNITDVNTTLVGEENPIALLPSMSAFVSSSIFAQLKVISQFGCGSGVPGGSSLRSSEGSVRCKAPAPAPISTAT